MENINMEYFKQFVDASGVVVACVILTALLVIIGFIALSVYLADKKLYGSKYNELVEDYNELDSDNSKLMREVCDLRTELINMKIEYSIGGNKKNGKRKK